MAARTPDPSPRDADAPSEYPYGHLITPLRQRGASCIVEYGLSGYIVHAELPDGTALIISPPQEPHTDHPPGFPESWLVTRGNHDDSTLHEIVYDSEPGGVHAQYGGSVPRLLAAIDARLDQLGLPSRRESRGFGQESAADLEVPAPDDAAARHDRGDGPATRRSPVVLHSEEPMHEAVGHRDEDDTSTDLDAARQRAARAASPHASGGRSARATEPPSGPPASSAPPRPPRTR